MVLWQLFKTFLMMGFVSFGGGYAMIPLIGDAVTKYHWMTAEKFTNMIAIAGMSPGPIATNSAILVGYSAAGYMGAMISVLAILLPSILLVIIVSTFFMKIHHNSIVQSMFYGLKPIVASLIIYAALSFALTNHIITFHPTFRTMSQVVIFGLSLFALLKLRWHPLYVILLSGLVGIALYT